MASSPQHLCLKSKAIRFRLDLCECEIACPHAGNETKLGSPGWRTLKAFGPSRENKYVEIVLSRGETVSNKFIRRESMKIRNGSACDILCAGRSNANRFRDLSPNLFGGKTAMAVLCDIARAVSSCQNASDA